MVAAASAADPNTPSTSTAATAAVSGQLPTADAASAPASGAAAAAGDAATTSTTTTTPVVERLPIPLIDYILNVMKFIDAILSNNATDDHCRDFVYRGGLSRLLRVLALPNLPVDCPITTSAQAVAAVCKSIMNLTHEPQVLQEGLEQLANMIHRLDPLQEHWQRPRGSVLLGELANCRHIETAFSTAAQTPLLHAMSAVHG